MNKISREILVKRQEVLSELVKYGHKIVETGLVAGAGGNISARWKGIFFVKPSGFAFDELTEKDYVGIDIKTGRIISGIHKPTSEVLLHLYCYRNRPDINAVVHTHSPWAGGVISSGRTLKPMFAEFVCDLENVAHIPYFTPTTVKLAEAVGRAIAGNNAVLMTNHGVVTVGITLKLAYYRNHVVEDAAKSLVAASVVGRPHLLSKKNIADIKKLDAVIYRQKVLKQTGGKQHGKNKFMGRS